MKANELIELCEKSFSNLWNKALAELEKKSEEEVRKHVENEIKTKQQTQELLDMKDALSKANKEALLAMAKKLQDMK